MDLQVLCDVMDRVCGTLVIAATRKNVAPLHEVYLPSHWVPSLAPNLAQILENKANKLELYAQTLQNFLVQLYRGKEIGPYNPKRYIRSFPVG